MDFGHGGAIAGPSRGFFLAFGGFRRAQSRRLLVQAGPQKSAPTTAVKHGGLPEILQRLSEGLFVNAASRIELPEEQRQQKRQSDLLTKTVERPLRARARAFCPSG